MNIMSMAFASKAKEITRALKFLNYYELTTFDYVSDAGTRKHCYLFTTQSKHYAQHAKQILEYYDFTEVFILAKKRLYHFWKEFDGSITTYHSVELDLSFIFNQS